MKGNLCGPTSSLLRGNFRHVDVVPRTMLGELEPPECSPVRLLMLPVDTPAKAEQPKIVANLRPAGSDPRVGDGSV